MKGFCFVSFLADVMFALSTARAEVLVARDGLFTARI
jgi:hypothetical protein